MQKKGQNFLNDYVYTVNSTKCLGLKVINAGGTNFFHESETFNLDDVVPSYGVTSRQILTSSNRSKRRTKNKRHFCVHTHLVFKYRNNS